MITNHIGLSESFRLRPIPSSLLTATNQVFFPPLDQLPLPLERLSTKRAIASRENGKLAFRPVCLPSMMNKVIPTTEGEQGRLHWLRSGSLICRVTSILPNL